MVALSWRAGRSDNHAHWVFQPGAHGGTVTALDEHASDLVEGPAGAAAAHRRCGGRHDPSGRGATARALAGGAVACSGVRQLPRPHTDADGRRTAHAARAVATRAACAAADRAAGRSAAGGAPVGGAAGRRAASLGNVPSSRVRSSAPWSSRLPHTGRQIPAPRAGGTAEAGNMRSGPRGSGGSTGPPCPRCRRLAPAARARRRRHGARGPDRAPVEPERREARRLATPAEHATPAAARHHRSVGDRTAGRAGADRGACAATVRGSPVARRTRSGRTRRPDTDGRPAGCTDRDRPGRQRSTRPCRAGGVDAGRPDPRRPQPSPRRHGPRRCGDRRPRSPRRRRTPGDRRAQAHAQGQAGHAVVGRGAPRGPRAPLSRLIDDPRS